MDFALLTASFVEFNFNCFQGPFNKIINEYFGNPLFCFHKSFYVLCFMYESCGVERNSGIIYKITLKELYFQLKGQGHEIRIALK